MSNSHIKCSSSLMIWEIHTKLALRYHLMPMKILHIKKSENSVREVMVIKKPSLTVGEMLPGPTSVERNIEISKKK